MASRKIFWHFLHANFFHVYIINTGNIHEKILLDSDWLRAVQFILFNLICSCEFFKKLKLHSLKWLVQFQLFEKLTSVKPYDYLY